MRLRWLVKKHPRATIEEVRYQMYKRDCSFWEATAELNSRTIKELQYFIPWSVNDDLSITEGRWVTVPEVFEEAK